MTAAVASPAAAPPVRETLLRLVTAGLAGGAVDFAYASTMGVIGGGGVLRVWQGVASFWLGKAAGHGGLASFSLGVITHFSLATLMAGGYALAAWKLPVLYRRWLLCAPVYGVILYGIMYRVVMPLRWPSIYPSWHGAQSLLDICAHMVLALAAAFVLSRGRFDTQRTQGFGAAGKVAS